MHSTYGDLFTDGLQTVWNASSLRAYDTCPRYYKLTIIDGWRAPKESVHLTFGAHYAHAQMRFQQIRHGGADHDQALRSVVRETLVRAKGFNPEHTKNLHTLLRSIVWYADTFRYDLLPLAEIGGAPAVEIPFRFEAGPGIEFVGQIDRLVILNNSLMVMDQKTTGSTISSHYFTQFHLSHQFSLYIYAGHIVTAEQVAGAIIDAAQIAVGFSRFERGLTYRTKGQLEEWHQNALTLIEQAHRDTETDNFLPRFSSCNNYGGCIFRDVCMKPKGLREQYLQYTFVREPADG